MLYQPMMNYQDFVEDVRKRLEEHFDCSHQVLKTENTKNNNTKRVGITIKEEQSSISPTIYMDSFYSLYTNGDSLDEIVELILFQYNKAKAEQMSFGQAFDTSVLTDFEAISSKIVCKLINRDKNKGMLNSIPHLPYMDLEIVFYVLIESSDNGSAIVPITNSLLDVWNVDEDTVFRAAEENSKRVLPPVLTPMHQVLDKLDNGTRHDESGMYVLSNEYGNYGASCILYDGVLRQIGNKFGENYYIIPSSVHEVIVIPCSKAPDDSIDLMSIISEVNECIVDDEEFLSNNLYYYDRSTDEVSIFDDSEEINSFLDTIAVK